MRSKVVELNLEWGMPTVDHAVRNLVNQLSTYKRQGYKAVIIIHGYGASGVGGSIKAAVVKCLDGTSMRGIVRAHIGGRAWRSGKRSILELCKGLEEYERRIADNDGVTVAILR